MQLLDEYDKQYPMQGMDHQYDMYDEMYYDQTGAGQQQHAHGQHMNPPD